MKARDAMIKRNSPMVSFEAAGSNEVLKMLTKLRKMDQEGAYLCEKQIEEDLTALFNKWEIRSFSVNQDAYTGIVLECISEAQGNVVIKIYPPFLRKRFIKETFIMKTLKNYNQAPLLDIDEKKQAMLLKQIIPGSYIDFEKDKTEVLELFREMLKNKIPVSSISEIPSEITGVVELTEQEYEIAKNYGYHRELIGYLLKCAKKTYEKHFAKEEKYLLHGDAYYKNVLHAKEGLYVIDPVGYQDAFVFEFMPMLTYELVMHSPDCEYSKKYKELEAFFSSITNIDRFREATFIFLVKQLIPSIYEADDGFIRANKYLSVIRSMFLDEEDKYILD